MAAPTCLFPVHQNGPPLLPNTFPLQHMYLHAPFELGKDTVHPELHHELGTPCKRWHVRAQSTKAATALLCSPLHTPPALASCPHLSPSYSRPYLSWISMDCHGDGHYGHLRVPRIPKLSVSWLESIPSIKSSRTNRWRHTS